jgi:fumarate hydratase class I
MLPAFFDSVLELIVKTSTDLPPDVRAAMRGAVGAEPAGTRSAQALTIIAQNIDQAAGDEGAICQDTGMPTFVIHTPVGVNPRRGGARHQPGQAAAQLRGFDHRRKLR